MKKHILKKIAKDLAKGILLATAMDEEDLDDVLSPEEQAYINAEVEKIANMLTDEVADTNLVDIVKKYYDF